MRKDVTAKCYGGDISRKKKLLDKQVLRKRPYLTNEMCRAVVDAPVVSEVQEDGRLRFWGEAALPGEAEARILRVVTLEDGTTIHNAFIDRGFGRETP